ncbi:MAG TPA: pitrilysin family protein [Balneolaceae bacterium]|nr:pitrilysin family protein [Balneolaceae bacterium]
MTKRLILIVVMLFSISTLSYAQKKYNKLTYPKLDQIKEPNVTTFQTGNGIKFFMVEDHELPLVKMNVTVRTGGVEVPANKTGLAQLTGMVMRSGGTKSIPADSLNALLEDNAAHLNTSIGFSSGSASLNVLKSKFDDLLPVFIDVLKNPAFPVDKIQQAKKRLKSAISRRNDNTQSIGTRVFQQLIYGKNSVYGRNPQYATVNNIKRQDLLNFHDHYFDGKNMLVGIVGDFDADTMKAKLKKAFSSIKAGQAANLDFPKVHYQFKKSINFANKSDVDQSLIMMGYIGGMRDNPDYAKVQVMDQVLSGGFSGRLMQQVRTNMGLAYEVGGNYGMNSFYPGWFYMLAKTKSSTTAKTIKAMKNVAENLKKHPISQKELKSAKDHILNSSVFHHDSYSKILNERISNVYRGLPQNSYQKYLQGVRNTTVQDVHKMAQKYLHPDSMQILVVGNKKQIGNQLQQFGKVNKIDISIPQPGQNNQKSVKGNAKKGKELLGKMADAVIRPGTNVKKFTLSGSVKVSPRGQTRTLKTTMTVDFSADSIEQNIHTPRGTMKVSFANGKGVLRMGGQKRSLPSSSSMVKGLKSSLNRSIVAIAMKAGQLNPQFMGTENVKGNTYNKVSVKVSGKNITLLLDPKTNLPAISRQKSFNPQQGKQVTVENHYADWTSKNGLTYPFKQSSYVGGKKQSEADYSSMQVNGQK